MWTGVMGGDGDGVTGVDGGEDEEVMTACAAPVARRGRTMVVDSLIESESSRDLGDLGEGSPTAHAGLGSAGTRQASAEGTR